MPVKCKSYLSLKVQKSILSYSWIQSDMQNTSSIFWLKVQTQSWVFTMLVWIYCTVINIEHLFILLLTYLLFTGRGFQNTTFGQAIWSILSVCKIMFYKSIFLNKHVKIRGGMGLGIYFYGWSPLLKILKSGSHSMGWFP